jgi:hypothetical protein
MPLQNTAPRPSAVVGASGAAWGAGNADSLVRWAVGLVTVASVAATGALVSKAATTAATTARHNRQHRPIRKVVAIVITVILGMIRLNLRAVGI